MTGRRKMSASRVVARPLQSLFAEEEVFGVTTWSCRLCPFEHAEDVRQSPDYAVQALYILAKHLKDHIAT